MVHKRVSYKPFEELERYGSGFAEQSDWTERKGEQELFSSIA